MVRTIGSNGAKTIEAIRKAGLRLIHQHGFEAMSLRALAADVGISQGALYNHIATKQELLFDLIRAHMTDLLGQLVNALSDAKGPVEAMEAFIGFHVDYHVTRTSEVFISYSELRSLDRDHYEAVVAMRRVYEQRLNDIIDEGVQRGFFETGDVRVAAFGILSLLSGVCTWFRPDGPRSKEEITAIYTRMILKGLAQTQPDGLKI
jgi:AcrR family transcriptional regulator